MNERNLQKLMKLLVEIICRENRVAIRTFLEEGSQILHSQNITDETLNQVLNLLKSRNLIRIDNKAKSIEILTEIFNYIDWLRI